MKGEHVHILEKDPLPGGACDGYKYQDIGYVMRGGREMDNHFECMWDLFRSIPSICLLYTSELHKTQLDAVQLGAEMVDQHNLQREQRRAEQQLPLAAGQAPVSYTHLAKENEEQGA